MQTRCDHPQATISVGQRQRNQEHHRRNNICLIVPGPQNKSRRHQNQVPSKCAATHGQPTHMQETHMQVYSVSSASRSDASRRARSSLDNFATIFVMTKMASHSSSPADTAAGVASEVVASALLDEASANQQRKVSGEEVIHVCLLQVTYYTWFE